MPEPQNVVILGGGVAGLAAAHYLARDGHRVTVVERAPHTGGLCASFQSHGFTLDHGPHKMYSVVPGVLDELRSIMGDELIEHQKRNRIRLLGRYLDYPLSLGNLLPLLGPVRSVKMGLDYAVAMASGVVNGKPAVSYEDYVVRRFGRSVYQLVFEPLARKVWGDPKKLAAELAAARIPSGGATELILATPEAEGEHARRGRAGFLLSTERLRLLSRQAGCEREGGLWPHLDWCDRCRRRARRRSSDGTPSRTRFRAHAPPLRSPRLFDPHPWVVRSSRGRRHGRGGAPFASTSSRLSRYR